MSLDVVISTPTVTGQVGSLLTLLSRILCVGPAGAGSLFSAGIVATIIVD